MPQIFDNIEKHLLTALSAAMGLSERADFCVGYFNLRGWRQVDSLVEQWAGGDGHCCRLLVGMQQMPQDQLRSAMSLLKVEDQIDQATAIILKRRLAQEFRDQLMVGLPTNEDEAGLRRLAAQITAGKLVVKLFLRHPLHAKLYLLFRQDPLNPKIGYLGSSNLTLAGLSKQGELNVDVLDHDACDKLARWFEDRWNDRFCIDISKELVEIINKSWARPEPIPPYHIYVKMAYHLSQEARAGLTEFRIPSDFGNKLFEFQIAAVKIAAHHLNKRGGVVIGDVVGLGKTLMATALARIFEDDHGVETLIICPKNLVKMWEDYRQQYRLRAKVLIHHPSAARAPRPATLPAGAHRRKPQPSQPRGQSLSGHCRIHQRQRQPRHPAVSHAVQQDLSRPVQPASAVHRRAEGHRHPAGEAPAGAGRNEFIRRHQMPGPFAGGIREERHTPTIGAT